MHYSAILVQTSPADHSRCLHDLENLPGAEVHYSYPETGKCVVILESASTMQQEEMFRTIQANPRVLLVELIYHYLDVDTGTPAPDRDLPQRTRRTDP